MSYTTKLPCPLHGVCPWRQADAASYDHRAYNCLLTCTAVVLTRCFKGSPLLVSQALPCGDAGIDQHGARALCVNRVRQLAVARLEQVRGQTEGGGRILIHVQGRRGSHMWRLASEFGQIRWPPVEAACWCMAWIEVTIGLGVSCFRSARLPQVACVAFMSFPYIC